MNRRAARLLALPVLVALWSCQVPGESAREIALLRSSLGAEQAALRAEIGELRAALLQSVVASPGVAAVPRAGVVRVVLEALAAVGEGPMEASASVVAPNGGAGPVAADDATISLLVNELDTIEQQRGVLCENVANNGTVGYKRREVITAKIGAEGAGFGAPVPTGLRIWMAQGALETTGNPLDLAIEGNGFFEIQMPNGELRYTRNGAFRQDVKGRLVTPEGDPLTDAINIPEDSQGLSVADDGQVFTLEEGNVQSALGTISLRAFPNASGLRAIGSNLYAPTAASGQAQRVRPGTRGTGVIRQGYVERSNVVLRREIVKIQQLDRQAGVIRRLLAEQGIFAL